MLKQILQLSLINLFLFISLSYAQPGNAKIENKIAVNLNDSTFTDLRDGQSYKTVLINGKRWMAENLNWAGAGVCYDNSSTNCNKYGRLYTIDELTGRDTSSANPSDVQGIAPTGWHIPSLAEWQELVNFCGGWGEAAKKLRAKTGWPAPNENTDDFGFNLLPGGHYVSAGGVSKFQNIGTGAKIWTSSADGNGYFIAINAYAPGLTDGPYSPPPDYVWRFSCRCVEDVDEGIVVNSTGDEPDADLEDGVCDVDPNTPGNQCTLRAAIQTANHNPGKDKIKFDIHVAGIPVINTLTPLPAITEEVDIDGFTQK